MTPNRPLRILLISRRYSPQIGGAERVMANLASALAGQGHLVTVLASASAPDGIGNSIDLAEASPAANPKVIRLKYSGRRVIGTFGYMRRIYGWIKTHRPDVVYVSMLKQDALAAGRACAKCGIPLLLRPEGAGHTGDMAWQKRHWMGRLVRRACRRAEAIVALSPTIRQELLAEGYPEGRIHNIANGVAIPEQAWVPPGQAHPTGIFVGRLAEEKGLDTLIQAWAVVARKVPGAGLRLIGAGPMEPGLRQLSEKLDIGPLVEFAGAQGDVEKELRQASVFLLPSREEGLSMALLEAMALGMPVVVSDIPGNRTLVEHCITGQLARAGDPQMLAEAILKVLSAGPEFLTMASAGRELVATGFSIQAVAKAHVELMRKIQENGG